MIELFAGYEQRESAGYATFCSSVIRRATRPVAFRPLAALGLPHGSNAFTLSRFLVPHLMNHRGHAIFADGSDMLCIADIAELDALYDPAFAVQVVRHPEYLSLHTRKYVGTEMECRQSNYARKNWASLMLINCEHRAWVDMSPKMIAGTKPLELLQFQKFLDAEIGYLPPEWNVLIDEGQESEGAKILHWSSGLPMFKHYKNQRRSKDWFAEYDAMIGTMQEA